MNKQDINTLTTMIRELAIESYREGLLTPYGPYKSVDLFEKIAAFIREKGGTHEV